MIALAALVSVLFIVLWRRRKARQRRDGAPVVQVIGPGNDAVSPPTPGWLKGSRGAM